MSNYAIISINGAQQKVHVGDTVRMRGHVAGETVTFDQVYMLGGDTIIAGSPTVNKAVVTASVGATLKGDKIRVAKFKAKSKYHRVRGYRDIYTLLTITAIQH